MTNGELGTICGAILTGLSGIGAVLRWCANRITVAIESGYAVVERNTTALIANTAATAELKVLVAGAHQAAKETQAAVEEVADEVTGNHELVPVELVEQPQPPPVPRKTPVGGYAVVFAKQPRKGTRS